jgi:hypothetical protein
MNSPIYISNGGDALGPYEMGQLRSMWNTGQLTANSLYWNEDNKEWRIIAELGLGDLQQAPMEVPNPSRDTASKVEDRPKAAQPVRYWAARIGGLGLFGGFFSALANYGAPPAVAVGMALPMGLIFAGIGAIVGLIVKRKSG